MKRHITILITILLLCVSFASADIFISEVMYNPSNDQGGNDFGEWVEIYNNGSDIDLTNWKLCGTDLKKGYVNHSDSLIYEDNSFILQADKYALITDGGSGTDVYDNLTVDGSALALHVDAATICTSGLSNSGELINISNGTDSALFNYTDLINLANGNGKTLERYNFRSDNWAESNNVDGTPGAQNSIYDNEAPIVMFTINSTPINEGESVLLNATQSTDKDIIDYKWEFGDGNTQSGAVLSTTTYQYNENKTYDIRLTITDSAGFTNSTTNQLIVDDLAPTAEAGADQTVDEGTIVNFDGRLSVSSPDTIVSYEWDIDNDGTYDLDGVTNSTTYADNGIYTVTLRVTDEDGSTATDTLTITVNDVNPNAEAGDNKTVAEDTLVIFNASQSTPGSADDQITKYEWNFGDGSTAEGIISNHTYILNGNYTVTLTVTDEDSTSQDTLTVDVTYVNDAPLITPAVGDITFNEDSF
ncbi:MAG: PKD domain-containing protein, partial [Nanoarchaeota archaeon]